MKKTVLAFLGLGILAAASSSCERHSWEETQALQGGHGSHGDHAAADKEMHGQGSHESGEEQPKETKFFR